MNRGHLTFLERDVVADSVEGAQSLMKAHAQFEARLSAQEVSFGVHIRKKGELCPKRIVY